MKRAYPGHPMVGVGAVIIRNKQILLVKRKGEPGKGKWSIPGGLVELGENVEQTVTREVKEETGLEVDNPELLDVVNNVVPDKEDRIRYHYVIIDYFVKLKCGKAAAADDAEELRWVELNDVGKHDLTKTIRAFFERNKQKLENLDSSSDS